MKKNQKTFNCHAELVSASSGKQIPNQVRNDNHAEFVGQVCPTDKAKQKSVLAAQLPSRLAAFTLAEVLITLAIIGVVAGLTIPSLLANTNEKGLNTADSVFQRRLGEALKIMNLQGTLAGHQTTQEFVDELGKHIKIMKTCTSDKLSECFVSEFQAGEETINVSDLKKSKNLYKTTNYKTETIGVIFGNGVRALVAYNPKATQNQFDNSNTTSPVKLTTSGTGKNTLVSLETDSLSILYNLQERKNNNIYDNVKGNIRGISIILGTGPESKCIDTEGNKCVLQLASNSAINTCSDSTYDTHGTDNSYCSNNDWAGAQKACADLKMRLPEEYELVALFTNDNWYGKPTDGWFWSATENGTSGAWVVFYSGRSGAHPYKWGSDGKVLCVTK